MDSQLPNIIDSLLVNLDNLQLGDDFTEEMMFTGFHNISTMTMSFRVQCSPDFCGPNCNRSLDDLPGRVDKCNPDGSLVCVEGWDEQQNCLKCLSGRNQSTNCSTCLSGYSGDSCTSELYT